MAVTERVRPTQCRIFVAHALDDHATQETLFDAKDAAIKLAGQYLGCTAVNPSGMKRAKSNHFR